LPLSDASVDLIVTSPPYWSLRSYTDGGEHYAGQIGAEATPAEYVDSLIECTREWMRVIKPTGSIWVNLGDKYGSQKSLIGLPWRYALRCIDELGLILRAEVIWSKPNGLPESVTDRVRRSHETWFHFTVAPRYYAAVDAIREPHTNPADHGRAVGSKYADGTTANITGGVRILNPLGKLPGSVWTIATQPLKVPAEVGIDHFAAFPMEWPRRIIAGWSPPSGTVLDPFGGTGTTALVASMLGRKGISVDMSADYCRVARWRVNDPKEQAKALRKLRS
jgi:site-specific DNA-methyltransferase (cytosine-N4-specific)